MVAPTNAHLLTMDWRAVWEDRPDHEAGEALPSISGNLGELQYSTEVAHSIGSCSYGALCLGKAVPGLPTQDIPAYCG